MKILFVDDDPEIRLAFSTALSRRGHTVVVAATAEVALLLMETEAPEVGVIDVMLPDGNGFTLCRIIREQFGFPAIMLTARDDDVDVVGGLEAGADDYIVKPVSPTVLEARLRTVLRRNVRNTVVGVQADVTVGELVISESASSARIGDTMLDLTATEFQLLLEFALHPKQTLSREQLIDAVWIQSPPSTQRVVDTTIQRLRTKLVQTGSPSPRLETVRGIGYQLR